ncbi:hypothetical protein APA_5190 [Pseudanabaena sp. lw0831]|nr:hypothetical protein APA_5190 [Pseudanabaena sp. lw0831]
MRRFAPHVIFGAMFYSCRQMDQNTKPKRELRREAPQLSFGF